MRLATQWLRTLKHDFVLPRGKTCGKLPLCLDGTLKSCYNNLGLKSSDDDLPHRNAEVHAHLSENVFAYAISTSA